MVVLLALIILASLPLGKELLGDWGKLKGYGLFWGLSTAVFLAIISLLWIVLVLVLLFFGAFVIYDMI